MKRTTTSVSVSNKATQPLIQTVQRSNIPSSGAPLRPITHRSNYDVENSATSDEYTLRLYREDLGGGPFPCYYKLS